MDIDKGPAAYLKSDTVCLCLSTPSSLAATEAGFSSRIDLSFRKNLPLSNDYKELTFSERKKTQL